MEKELRQVMYGFVMYQLGATIHAGIQYGHAKDEFSIKYGRTKTFKRWLHKDKVYMIKNGGTTNSVSGGLQTRIKELEERKIKYATFREEDMDNILTSIAFLIDERVWDTDKYPSLEDLAAPGNKFGDFKDIYFFEKQAKVLEKKGIFELRKWLAKFPLAK